MFFVFAERGSDGQPSWKPCFTQLGQRKMRDAHWGLGVASGWVGGWLLVRGDVATQRFHKADELQRQNYRHCHLMQPLLPGNARGKYHGWTARSGIGRLFELWRGFFAIIKRLKPGTMSGNWSIDHLKMISFWALVETRVQCLPWLLSPPPAATIICPLNLAPGGAIPANTIL